MALLNRRDFLQGSATLAALMSAEAVGLKAGETQPQGNGNAPRGANERLNVAVIGAGGRGQDHIGGFAGRNNCVVTHVCDTDTAHGRGSVQRAEEAQGSEPRFVQDLRRVLDDRSVDIVSIATPNHWHALAAIWAIQAGKDVYVEKPVSHNVSEGRRIVQFARRHNKIVQAGTQIRSQPGIRQAIEYVRSGQIGKLQIARGLCYKPRGTIRQAPATGGTVPNTIDYDLWCGPAPRQNPMRRIRLHYDWHWTWDYGNGDLGNQGIHQMDVARWGIGSNELARSAISVGGRFGYVDDGETANTQVSVFDYGDAKLIFEVRGLRTAAYRNAMVGNVFHCSDGYLVCTSYNNAVACRPNGEVIRRFDGSADHYGNFVSCVRSRRREDLHGEILEGHLSSALCHIANLSYRLGREVAFNRREGIFGQDQAADETLNATVDHLTGNMVDVTAARLRVGARLNIDARNETFTNNQDANRQLTREYRKGFVVPATA